MAGMTDQYDTCYQALGSTDEEENELPLYEASVLIHEAPSSGHARWNHIENLDEFFTRVYHYHQRHGFMCMVVDDLLQLLQYAFIVSLSAFLFTCIDYPVLFAEKHLNGSRKVTIPDVIKSPDRCYEGFTFNLIVFLIIAAVFWVFRIIKVFYNVSKYLEMRAFYLTALKIASNDLPNMTWHDVQRTMLDVQKDVHMCIHKQELTELDIYHRILRFKNYMIAMVNKSVISFVFNWPFIGKRAYLSSGLKYNIEMILFWGPWSPFENNWQLKKMYKLSQERHNLAEKLSRRFVLVGLTNLILFPVIFFWQILYCFFRYGELIKRQPGFLGSRRWSEYARLYLRHFNELDHEFRARLNRGYLPATTYLNIFTNPLLVILAKNVAFFTGSILAVIIVLTVIDEDVLTVEHVLTIITLTGLTVTICRVFIPDHNAVFCPEQLLMNILAHIHYMPDDWRGNAHTERVRNNFSLLFQFKAEYLIEELFSPIITPFILCFSLRRQSLAIVDFFRNFTIDVVGVGDVCSFAQMDIRQHGQTHWTPQDAGPEPTLDRMSYTQAEEGKTELSLLHFHMTNPEWVPPQTESIFINTLKGQAQQDAVSLMTPSARPDNPVLQSLVSLQNPLLSMPSMLASAVSPVISPAQNRPHQKLRGAVSQAEGPLVSTTGSGGLLSSLHSSGNEVSGSIGESLVFERGGRRYDDSTLEMLSNDMSFSALYMHEIRHRRLHGLEVAGVTPSRQTWFRPTDNNTLTSLMPNIEEENSSDVKFLTS